MGGNALKTVSTRRYSADEYFKLTPKVINIITLLEDVMRVEIIPAYNFKESFGDCDVLYTTYTGQPIDAAILADAFKSTETVRNSEVTSLDFHEFQIDLIYIQPDCFDYGMSYFKFNDCGNLVGKLAHQYGLKHGHKGLVLPLRNKDNKFSEVLLTQDHTETLKFLGLSIEAFNRGFDTLGDIFEFIAASPIYSPDLYLLENLNSIAKIRDRKRDTYRKFLEFGCSYTGPRSTKIVDKSECLETIFKFFPKALPIYNSEMAKIALIQVAKEKFNGDIVSEWTGLTDIRLGKFMKILRSDFYFTNEVICYLTTEQIRNRVMIKLSSVKL